MRDTPYERTDCGPIVGRFEIGDFCWVQPVDPNERCSMFALHDAVILEGQ